jgi:hypothetical protein
MPEKFMHRRNTITFITFTLVFHTLRVLAVENVKKYILYDKVSSVLSVKSI